MLDIKYILTLLFRTVANEQDDLDYMDENAERLARRKMKSDAMKRQFAINGMSLLKPVIDVRFRKNQESPG